MDELPIPSFRRDLGRLFRYGALYIGPGSLPTIRTAYSLARRCHGPQLRSDGSPYVVHLLRVASYTLRYGPEASEAAAAAALLHDAVEDTSLSVSDIEVALNADVAAMVEQLTRYRPVGEDFAARAVSKAEKLRCLSRAPRVVACIKCFDLLDNVLSWKYINRAHPHWEKLPRWLSEAVTLYVPFCMEISPLAGALMAEEVQKFSELGVTPGRLVAY